MTVDPDALAAEQLLRRTVHTLDAVIERAQADRVLLARLCDELALLPKDYTLPGLRGVHQPAPVVVTAPPSPTPAPPATKPPEPPPRPTAPARAQFTEEQRHAAVRMATEEGDAKAAKTFKTSRTSIANWRRQGFGRKPDYAKSGDTKLSDAPPEPAFDGPTTRCPECRAKVPVRLDTIKTTTTPATVALREHLATKCPRRRNR